jgi:hypothetical protein
MHNRAFLPLIAVLACTLVAGCSEPEVQAPPEVLGRDPLLARALNDPLMVDPDLSWRNEANAVIAIRDGHPLPPFDARDNARQRARDAARIELLENGQIPPLPAPLGDVGKPALASVTTADEMIRAVGAPADCIDGLTDDLNWSTGLPPTSSIMPHGMVRQAAGVDQGTCVIRVVRYLTPVSPDDALEYHFTKADRARFRIERFAAPEAQLHAERRDQEIAVHVREGPGGMTAVDVIHWRK